MTELPAGIFPMLKDSESTVVEDEPFIELLLEVLLLFEAVVPPETSTTVTTAPVALAVPSFVISICSGLG
jgi:hypothetical protein